MTRLVSKHTVFSILQALLTILIALLMGAVVMQLSGKDAVEAYTVLFSSALGDKTAIANTLLAATPLIFTGLGAAIAFRAGVFNVGVEGSLYLGAFVGAWAGFTFVSLPAPILIALCFILALIVGGVWCYIPGVLRARLDVDEIVTTIMLNYVAILFTSYLVNYPFRVPGLANAMSEKVAEGAQLTRLAPPSQLNLSFLIALAGTAIMIILFRRTTLGYELRSIGDNPLFARWSGMPATSVVEKVMFISGALGGIAGAGQALGVHYRFVANFSPGFGFDGITVALLGHNSPLGTFLAALLFGALRSGGSTMELFTDVPRDLIRVLEATIIFFVAIEFSWTWLRSRIPASFDKLLKAEGRD